MRHTEVLKRIGQRAGHLRHVGGEAGLALDVGVDDVGGGLSLLFGKDGLLFQQRSEEFVRILKGAEGEYSCSVDLVQHRDFGVEIWVIRERILFQISHLRLNVLGLARMEPMVAMALAPAPSASSTVAYWDFTRASSSGFMPESWSAL